MLHSPADDFISHEGHKTRCHFLFSKYNFHYPTVRRENTETKPPRLLIAVELQRHQWLYIFLGKFIAKLYFMITLIVLFCACCIFTISTPLAEAICECYQQQRAVCPTHFKDVLSQLQLLLLKNSLRPLSCFGSIKEISVTTYSSGMVV